MFEKIVAHSKVTCFTGPPRPTALGWWTNDTAFLRPPRRELLARLAEYDDVIEVVANTFAFAAIKQDRTAIAWGADDSELFPRPRGPGQQRIGQIARNGHDEEEQKTPDVLSNSYVAEEVDNIH